jgi:hypothetical protein
VKGTQACEPDDMDRENMDRPREHGSQENMDRKNKNMDRKKTHHKHTTEE